MQNALEVIGEAHEAWGRLTGRYHAPLIEEYRMDDADFAIMTLGSMTGAGKDAVDVARERGARVGLVKVKTFRPFPVAAVTAALGRMQAVGVVDRSVDFGWNCGPLYRETLGALYRVQPQVPSMSFIGGLAGADITLAHFARVTAETDELRRGAAAGRTVWLNEND
jgi:pyruvate ferredoxin oxidoreductase alpha subunit/phenylglyoxylate dehydrogenase alpha subunit